jgi:hypothetical protein
MKKFSDLAIKYFLSIRLPEKLPQDISVLNPYSNREVKRVVKNYFSAFYNDSGTRIYLIGINPGRFGGGLTGISFTDPVALREHCKIENNLGSRKELSSKFIYLAAREFGGVNDFFSKVFLTALYPFALISGEKNLNYYDKKPLSDILKPQIIKNIQSQISFGARKDRAILLGRKNAKYFEPINRDYGFFEELVVLDHPRYIMQYKLKKIDSYISKYLQAIS